MLYKLVLVTCPLDHSRRMYSPSNFRFSQKTKKIKFVPITIIILTKINLEHLELLRPWGLRNSSLEAPGLHETNFNIQCYKDAIDLTSRWKVRFRQTFFKMKPKRCYTSQCWSQILLFNLGGVIASQTSGKLENQQNQISPFAPQLHNQRQINKLLRP